jgi:hypothetical protein
MESRVVVFAMIFTIVASCTKHEIENQHFQKSPAVLKHKAQPSVFISEWEAISSWAIQKNPDVGGFSFIRQFPRLNGSTLENGAVLVFARNLWADDPSFEGMDYEPDKPLMMPFYFLPYFEKPDYTEQWSFNVDADKITTSVVVKGGSGVSMPRKGIQLRYMIIPGEVLKEKNQTTRDIRRLSYNELIKTFQLVP